MQITQDLLTTGQKTDIYGGISSKGKVEVAAVAKLFQKNLISLDKDMPIFMLLSYVLEEKEYYLEEMNSRFETNSFPVAEVKHKQANSRCKIFGHMAKKTQIFDYVTNTGSKQLYQCSKYENVTMLKLVARIYPYIPVIQMNETSVVLRPCLLHGSVTMVVGFLEGGCILSCETPLYSTCKLGFNDIVKELLKYSNQIDIPNHKGETPLYAACENGHLPIVKTLLDVQFHANTDIPNNNNGYTPLHIACQKGDLPIIQELVKAGAKIDSVSLIGK
ncbi:unnamed protein product, partial [Meganyctiphanes norvegica]